MGKKSSLPGTINGTQAATRRARIVEVMLAQITTTGASAAAAIVPACAA